MGDPRMAVVTLPLAVGMDNVSFDEVVSLAGERPRLVESRNTRLSKVPGLVSKAPGTTRISANVAGSGTPTLGGVIPTADRDSALVPMATAANGLMARRVDGSNVEQLLAADNTSSSYLDAYFPIEVENAGSTPGGLAPFNVAACYVASTSTTYYAMDSSTFVRMCGVSDSGAVVMPTRLISSLPSTTTTANWLGLSVHGTKILLWKKDSGSNAIRAYTLAMQFGSTAEIATTQSTFSTVYTPANVNRKNVALAYSEYDTANVFLVSQNSGAANSVTVNRIDTATLGVSASVTIAMGGAWDNVAATYVYDATGGGVFLLAVSKAAGTTDFYELNATTLATVWSAVGILSNGIVGCGIDGPVASATRVIAVSQVPGATIGNCNTVMRGYSAAGALLTGFDVYLRSMRLVGQVAVHKKNSFYTSYFTCINQWADNSAYDPTSVNFVAEPAVQVFRCGNVQLNELACVARLGVDRVIRYPGALTGITGDYTVTNSNSCIVSGDRLLVTYLSESVEDGVVINGGYRPRYAWMSLAGNQPALAYEAGGGAIVAGALTAVWDGVEVTELSPHRGPVVSASGPLAGPLTGTFLVAAIIQWKDAQGVLHRSAPSNIATIALAAQTLRITYYVSHSARRPPTSTNPPFAHEAYTVIPYVSEANGLVLYAQSGSSSAMTNQNSATIDISTVPVVDAFHPAIYTDGSATQELPSFCPNATKACAVVQDRGWVLDAEIRGRGYYTKPRAQGLFLQFNPDCRVDFPSDAGNLRAVVGYNGVPVFLGDAGLWTIAGEGPDALLNPPDFAAPQQISDVACTQRNSVVRAPNGVMFVSNNRFAVFNGGVDILHDIDPTSYGTVIGTAVFRKQQEVCFFMSSGNVLVYNWEAAGWSLWDTTVTGVTTLTGCAQRPTDGKVLYTGDSGELWLMDPDTVHATAQISLTTGWLQFGGPQDENVLGDMVLHAKRAAAHGLTITTTTDYDGSASNTVTQTYSAADVLSDVIDTTNTKRYDLQPEVVKKHARAMQLVITETDAAGEAFQAAHISVEISKEAGKSARGLLVSGRK